MIKEGVEMAELPDGWFSVFNALIGAPVAWQSPAEIAATLGQGESETTDLLCDLELAGWVVVWDAENGPLVTLSPLAAERLSARIVEVGHDETPRWARVGDPDPPPVRPKHVVLSERAASLEFVADPKQNPALAAERAEQAEIAERGHETPSTPENARAAEILPRPSLFIGLGLSPWPGPNSGNAVQPSACPACGNRFLLPHMYCLYCDRWGLDRLRAVVLNVKVTTGPAQAASKARKALTDAQRKQRDRVEAERLRAERKAKRRKRK